MQYAGIPQGGSVLVLGLGPIGDMAARIALHLGAEQVFGADVVPERLARARGARRHGHRLDRRRRTSSRAVRDATDGRGPGRRHRRRRHGGARLARWPRIAQKATAVVPDAIMEKVMQVAGVDRLAALNTAIEAVRRGGTISLSGVYGGATDPLPLMRMFDKQIQLRMGQANVWRWVPDILPLLHRRATRSASTTSPPTTCRSSEAPEAYMNFREKKEGTVKVLLKP